MTDQNVEAYKQAMSDRLAKTRADREKIGNLAAGAAIYDHAKDGPMTIKSIAEAGNKMVAGEAAAPTSTFSDATIAGMKALSEASAAQHASAAPTTSEQWEQRPIEEAFAAEEPTEEVTTSPKAEAVKEVMNVVRADANEPLDEIEFDRMMGLTEQDSINNKAEREAIEAKLKPMSLAEGLATGSFKQRVPISQDFEVVFRSYSAIEHRQLRKLLWSWCDKDPTLDNMAAELFGNMIIAASVDMINDTKLPEHMSGVGLRAKFDEAAFTSKFDLISGYPVQILHSIGVHGQWFDQRVRELLKVANLKSG